MKTTNEELVEEMVRDFTKIQPRSKSEVRERINNLLAAKDAACEERVRDAYISGYDAGKHDATTPPLPDQGDSK